jgi:hypothetical protein
MGIHMLEENNFILEEDFAQGSRQVQHLNKFRAEPKSNTEFKIYESLQQNQALVSKNMINL